MTSTRFLIVNPSCLATLSHHRPWLETQGVKVLTGTASTTSGVESKQELLALLRGADALIGPTMNSIVLGAEDMQSATQLKVISLASSGYESVEVASATLHGIVVTYAPLDSLGEVVADLAWGLLLSVVRQIPEHHFRLQRGDADRGMGAMVSGRTLGIVGLGNVGQKVARRAAGFNVKVVATDTHPNLGFCEQHNITIVPLDDLLQQADFVSLHLRLTPETAGAIGSRELGLMKPTAYLINTGRWALVDETALAQAILEGSIAGVAVDDPPQGVAKSLLRLSNAVFTPHIGNRVAESVEAVCRQAYENALDVVNGRMPHARHVLNLETFDTSPRLSQFVGSRRTGG